MILLDVKSLLEQIKKRYLKIIKLEVYKLLILENAKFIQEKKIFFGLSVIDALTSAVLQNFQIKYFGNYYEEISKFERCY